jgi:uncharacterized repeat protein (TIGR02543 family)
MEFTRRGKGAKRLLAAALALALVVPAGLGFGVPRADAGAVDDITDLSVVVSNAGYQTWRATDGAAPPDLIVELKVTLSEHYTSGGAIELPLDFTPTNATHPSFTYGTDGTNGVGNADGFKMPPFFTLQTPELNNMVKDFDKTTEGALWIMLTDSEDPDFDEAGVTTINLSFAFNTAWDGKIPGGETLWNIKPTAYVNDDPAINATPVLVSGAADNVIMTSVQEMSPENGEYPGGAITVRSIIEIQDYYESKFDPNYDNIVYIEVPPGSTIDDGTKAYFDKGPVTGTGGYDRYYRVLNPDPSAAQDSDWNDGGTYGGPGDSRYLSSNYITPPDMSDGTEFEIRVGSKCRRINGDEDIISEPGVQSYTKTPRKLWDLYTNTRHATGDTPRAVSVCGLGDEDITHSGGGLNASYYVYENPASTKNIGTGPIKDVSFVLYQKEDGSAKLNFSEVVLMVSRDPADAGYPTNPDTSLYPAWSRYKVAYEIIDTNDPPETPPRTAEDSMGVWIPAHLNTTPPDYARAQKTLNLPALSATEYINKITVVPMGTDGLPESEGVWPSRNALALRYTAKAWTGRTWPDGTPVPDYTEVHMGWTLYYDDKDGNPKDFKGKEGLAYYTDAPYAQATLVSADAAGCKPGDTVTYTINGYNHDGYTEGEWADPRIMVRVPKVMELIDAVFTGTDVTTGKLTSGKTFGVSAELVGFDADADYNYYSFQAQDYSAPEGDRQNIVFSIPNLRFKVADTAAPATHSLRVLVSGANAAAFLEGSNLYAKMNNLPSGDSPINYGLDPENDNYCVMESDTLNSIGSAANPLSHTALRVMSHTDIGVKTTISSSVTGGLFVESAVVPADRNEDVIVRLTVSNKGNVPLTNIRLYDILPYVGDLLDSDGSISFISVEPPDVGAVVYYATGAPETLPPYGEHGGPDPDLQTASFWTTGAGWSTSSPPDATDATAVFIDFKSLELAPGEFVDIDMKFNVPDDAEDQTAFNQFLYSAVETINNASKINLPSPVAGFSTKAIVVMYNGNSPAPGRTPTGVPSAVSGVIGIKGYEGVTQSDDYDTIPISGSPALAGYTFAGWNTAEGGSGEWWGSLVPIGKVSQGASKPFNNAAGMLVLYAQWSANAATVTFYNNYDAEDTSTYVPGNTANADKKVGNTLTKPADPTRTGYTFNGWYKERMTANAWDFDTDVVPVSAVVNLYAKWTEGTTYTVTYHPGAHGTFAPVIIKNLLYGVSTPSSPTPAGKPGYTFTGWSPDIAEMVTEDVTYFAQWDENVKYTVTYDGNDNTGGAAPTDPSSPYYTGSTVTVLGNTGSLTKTNHTFAGWTLNGTTGTVYGTGGEFTITGNATLYAKWTENATYTVTYNGNGDTGGSVPTDTNSPYYTGSTVTVLGNTGDLVKTGHTFAGWTLNETTETYDAGETFTITGNATLKAKWTPNNYTLYFDKNAEDATAGTTLSKEVTYDTTVGTLPGVGSGAPARAGYAFAGWSTESSGPGHKVDFTEDFVYNVAGDKTVFAVWNADGSTLYKVEHYLVNASNHAILQDTDNKTGQTGTTACAEPKTYVGHTYDSAYTGAVPSGEINGNDLLVLKLYYPINRHNVTYAYSGEQPALAPLLPSGQTAVPYNQEMHVAKRPILLGYTFDGWTTSDVTVAGDGTFLMPDADVAFTGSWTLILHTVTFDGNGGTILPGNGTRTVPDGASLGSAMPPDPTRAGSYSFDGWYTAQTGGTRFDKDTLVTADIKVWAHWTYTGGDGGGGGGGGDPVDPGDPPDIPNDPPDIPNDPGTGNNGGGPAPPPPMNGGSVVPSDNGNYIEIDENGAPLGEWRWDEPTEQWIFDEYPPQSNLPQTGASLSAVGFAHLWVFPLLALLWLCVIWPRLRPAVTAVRRRQR